MTTFQRICTAGVGVVALAGATLTPAQAAAPAADRLSIRVSVGEPGGMSASAATCRVNRIVITRYESCAVADAMVTLLRNGRPVGNAKFKITHTMKLKQKSRKWSETTAISRATLTNAGGIKVAYTATCKGTCKTTNRVPQGRALGAAFSGKVNYVNNVKKNKKHTTETTYRFVLSAPRCGDGPPYSRTLPPGAASAPRCGDGPCRDLAGSVPGLVGPALRGWSVHTTFCQVHAEVGPALRGCSA